MPPFGPGVPGGLSGLGGMGNLPFPLPGPHPVQLGGNPYRPGGLSPISPQLPGGIAPPDPYNVSPAGAAQQALDDPLVQSLKTAARRLIWTVQPSPLESPPYRGRREDLTNRSVIAPPADSTNAAAIAAAQEIADAEESFSGTTINVLNPATSDAYVTLISKTVEAGQAFVVYSVGAWAHDSIGARDAIVWRVRVGSRILSAERELGLLGGMDNPLLLRDVGRPGDLIVVEARNLDDDSATLTEVRLQGWSFPLLQASDDDFFSLLDPYTGPTDQGRFAP